MIMQTFVALWHVFLHASRVDRLLIAVVVLLALSRLSQYPEAVGEWLAERYQVEGLSWRVWRARVRRREIWLGGHVLCAPDGSYGRVIALISCRLHTECPPAAVVRFETPGELPRVVPLAQLVAVPELYDIPDPAQTQAETTGGAR
jgi:hypothetical protein